MKVMLVLGGTLALLLFKHNRRKVLFMHNIHMTEARLW